MYAKVLREIKSNPNRSELSALAKKYKLDHSRLIAYFDLLAKLPKTHPPAKSWAESEKSFVKMFIEDVNTEIKNRTSVYLEASKFLTGRTKESVRLMYNRKIRENPCPVKRKNVLKNTKIVQGRLPRFEKEAAVDFLNCIEQLVSSYNKKEEELEHLKQDVNNIALQVVDLDEKQKKLSSVLKKARKLERETSVKNQKIKKKTTAILNYKEFGEVGS